MRLASTILALLLAGCGGSFDLNINKKDSTEDDSEEGEADDQADEKPTDAGADDADDDADDVVTDDDGDDEITPDTIDDFFDADDKKIGVRLYGHGDKLVLHPDTDHPDVELYIKSLEDGFDAAESKSQTCYFKDADCAGEFCFVAEADRPGLVTATSAYIPTNSAGTSIQFPASVSVGTLSKFKSSMSGTTCDAHADNNDLVNGEVRWFYEAKPVTFKLPFKLKPRS